MKGCESKLEADTDTDVWVFRAGDVDFVNFWKCEFYDFVIIFQQKTDQNSLSIIFLAFSSPMSMAFCMFWRALVLSPFFN